MARRALHLFFFAALLVAGAAASSSSSSGKAKDSPADKMARSKLPVAPVCKSVKDAGKNYDTCMTFREEVCESIVKSESCDICTFLKDDEGCDLQDGAEVAEDIAAAEARGRAYTDASIKAIFDRIVNKGARYAVNDGACAIAARVPDDAKFSCEVLPSGQVVVSGDCAEGTVAVSLGCRVPVVPGPIFPGSSTAGDWFFSPPSAQCVFPAGTPEGTFTYTCIPNTLNAAAAANTAAAAGLFKQPTGARAAAKKP